MKANEIKMMRRSRRAELVIMCALMVLLMINLIYFKKIEFQMDTQKYLSGISMGTSDRSNDDYDYGDGDGDGGPNDNDSNDLVLWPSLKKKFDKSKIQNIIGDLFRPEDFMESAEEKAVLEKRQNSESEVQDYFDQIPPPSKQDSNLDDARLLTNSYADFIDVGNDDNPPPLSTSHPLKPPKTVDLPPPMPDNKSDLALCPENASNQHGRIQPDVDDGVTLDEVQKTFGKDLYVGGFYVPPNCKARQRVAIIVPYRNREIELAIFLKNIHPFLMKQQIEYGIFVVEQTVGTKFNRGMLLNVGFLEAKKIKSFDCYIFHDVDLLPMDDRNFYICSEDNPRHLAMAVDKLDNTFPALNTLSGVIAVTPDQFEKINGYSNKFWGWGAEDLDFLNRLKAAGYHIDPFEAEIGRYATFNKHEPEKPNDKRFELLEKGETQLKSSGLNTTKYTVQCVDKSPLYTWIFTTLKEEVPGEASNVEMLGVN